MWKLPTPVEYDEPELSYESSKPVVVALADCWNNDPWWSCDSDGQDV